MSNFARARRNKLKNTLPRNSASKRQRLFENLETRSMMAANVWVNDNWFEQVNVMGGTPGVLDVGDTVANTGAGDDGTVTGKVFGIDAFSTIQSAITAVDNTVGFVNVLNGTYDEAITVNKDITIQKFGMGAATITRNSGSNQALVTVQSSGVTLDGLVFEVNQPFAVAGVYMYSSTGTPFTDLTVKNSVFTITGAATPNAADAYIGFSTTSTAIAVFGDNAFPNVTITDNQILVDSLTAPTAMFDRAIYTRAAHGLIDGNTIYGDSHDIVAQFVHGGTMTIDSNYLYGKGGKDTKGAQLDITEPEDVVVITNNLFTPFTGTTPSGSNHVRSLMIKNVNTGAAPVTVDGNIFSSVSDVGVLLAKAQNVTVKNNIFDAKTGDSTFTYVRVDTKVPTGGAVPQHLVNATIQGNIFHQGTVAGGRAIELANHDSIGADIGTITIGGAGALANTFELGLGSYIYLDASTGLSSASAFPYYTGPGAYATTTLAPFSIDIDATQNNFGVTSAPLAGKLPSAMTLSELFEVENHVYHKIDDSSLGLVTWKANNVYITTPGGGSTDSDIQRGIDAVGTAGPAWSVNVQAGTYVGQLDITKKVALRGAGQGNTIIAAPASMTLSNQFTYAGTVRQSVVAVRSANDVLIDGFTIDGDGRGATVVSGNDFHGIGLYNSSAAILNVTVTGVRDSSLSGIQRGRAIFGGNNAGTNTIFVLNSIVSDYQKSGIDMRGTGLTATITGNVVTGVGPTSVISQNGVVIFGGATGSVSYNIVSGHEFTPETVYSGGILVYGPDTGTGVIIDHNNLSGNQYGIYTEKSGTISYNNISGLPGVTYAIDVEAGDVIVENNNVTSSYAGLYTFDGNIKVQGNNFNGNTIGVEIEGGNVDLGDAGNPNVNGITGLGKSLGGNNFSSFSATATATSGAIVVEKLDPTVGPSGLPNDIPAYGNTWNNNTATGIENVIWHDADDSTLAFILLNTAPTADNLGFVTNSATQVTGNLQGHDAESMTLTYVVVTLPTKGTLSVNPATGAFVYTPSANSSGSDTFTYKVIDEDNYESNVATVTIDFRVTAVQVGNKLVIIGTGGIDDLVISKTPNSITVTGLNGTLINGNNTTAIFFGITQIDASLLNNNDSLWVQGGISLDTLKIEGGDGDDVIYLGNDPRDPGNNDTNTQTFRDASYLRVKQSLIVNTGAGNDLVYERKLRSYIAKTIDLGDGNDRYDAYWSLADQNTILGGIGNDTITLGFFSSYGVGYYDSGAGNDLLGGFASRYYDNVTFISGTESDTLAVDVNAYDKNVTLDTGTGNDYLLFARSTVAGLADIKTGAGNDKLFIGRYISSVSPSGVVSYTNGGSIVDRMNLDTGAGVETSTMSQNRIRQFFANYGSGRDDITIQDNLFLEDSVLDGGADGAKLTAKNNSAKLRFRNI